MPVVTGWSYSWASYTGCSPCVLPTPLGSVPCYHLHHRLFYYLLVLPYTVICHDIYALLPWFACLLVRVPRCGVRYTLRHFHYCPLPTQVTGSRFHTYTLVLLPRSGLRFPLGLHFIRTHITTQVRFWFIPVRTHTRLPLARYSRWLRYLFGDAVTLIVPR